MISAGAAMSPRVLSPRLALAALAAGAACRPEIPDPIFKGKHLHYSTTTNAPVCRGSFFRQEQHAIELARLLDVDLPEVIQYTRVSRSEIGPYCDGQSNDGCALIDDQLAFSIRSFSFHEIAHVVAHFGGLRGSRPFEEGFAQLFEDGTRGTKKRAPIEEVLRDFVIGPVHYQTMGLFSRFLVERYGLPRYVAFMRATDRDDDFDRMSEIFAGIFGEPLAAAMAEFDAYPSCSEMSNRLAVVDCNLPLEPWDGRSIDIHVDIACDQDDVLGPTPDGYMYTTRAFEVQKPGDYAFWPNGPEGFTFFRLLRCGSCWDVVDKGFELYQPDNIHLDPGRYYVLLGRHIVEPAELDLEISVLWFDDEIPW